MQDWQSVLDYWFPAELGRPDPALHHRQVLWWFGGGSTPTLDRFRATYAAARDGALEHWGEAPRSRLALIIVLDQFPRGLFAGTAEAYASDQHALRVTEEGFARGHYEALGTAWERLFFMMPLVHAEGPDHLARLDRVAALNNGLIALAPPPVRVVYEHGRGQRERHRAVIARFGRFPHRNAALGRASTVDEVAYIAAGDFPHLNAPPAP